MYLLITVVLLIFLDHLEANPAYCSIVQLQNCITCTAGIITEQVALVLDICDDELSFATFLSNTC